jgi:hypothetical protein
MNHPPPFIPGQPQPPQGLLARYRPLEPVGVAAAYVRQLTAPGDLVLDLFCQGPLFLRETVAAGRRALGVSPNPISLLLTGLALRSLPDPAALNAAFTHLADSPKGGIPLARHLDTLYHTRCPNCGEGGSAEWFAWDREAAYPYAKSVHCPRCAGAQEGPTDDADIAAARRFEPRGLPYHYALNRVAPVDHPARERAAELVALYTPRNLSALMDVTLRLEGLEAAEPVRRALQGLLLVAFDQGSSLDPHGEPRPRPRVLRPPARFLERNVWRLLEGELARWVAGADASAPLPRAKPAALLSDRVPAYALAPSAARETRKLLAPASVSLILADPPRPDGVFWALSALWSGWLSDSALARAMRPFLRRRRFDWEWHQEVLQITLAAVAPLLTPDGVLVTLFVESDEGLVESVCLAARAAGYGLTGWGITPGEGARLVWRVKTARPGIRALLRIPLGERPQEPPLQEAELTAAAARLARECLRKRAEPTPQMVLHTAVYAGLVAEAGRLPPLAITAPAVRQGLEGLGLEQAGETGELRWLPALDGDPVEPLADQLEERVWQTLRARPAWEMGELLSAVYAALEGPLTPDLSLVLLCLDSYGIVADGLWRLREEDGPARREAELQALRRDVAALGERLGFRVRQGQGWDVRWQEGGRDAFLFLLSSTAKLGRPLLGGPPAPPGARPCLVFPGGRAELVVNKLRRDVRLTRAVEEKGWQLIKFRHLRRLIAERLDRRLFEAVLGLDPIVESDGGVQIPLILGGEP